MDLIQTDEESMAIHDTDIDTTDPRKITKVAPDAPNRCVVMTTKGQCPNNAVQGGENCLIHGGSSVLKRIEGEKLHNYRLGKFRAQVARLGSSDGVKSLRDEIGILRMIMEERLNSCADATDLMMESHTISDLVMKIEKVVLSCTKLEASLGQTMDKQALLQFASQVIGIIGDHVTDTDVLDAISDAILQTLTSKSE